jgi:calcium-dependent protein kinase
MKKITEKEEKEMYDIIEGALLALCVEKPTNPVDFLSKKMLELVGDHSEMFRKRNASLHRSMNSDEVNVHFNFDKIQSTKYKKFNESYRVLNAIGMGTHGSSYVVQETNNEIQKCVKIVTKIKEDPHFFTESYIELLLTLDHPNIVKTFEVLEDEGHIYIIMEHCEGGDLLNFIAQRESLSEVSVKHITKQILDALNYLHIKGVVHRNIKPENILILKKVENENEEFIIKLADFGYSQFLGKKKRSEGKIVGSPLYISPEVIEGRFDYKCDLWSVGVLTYFLLSGHHPFTGKSYEIFNKILNTEITFEPCHTDLARDFISGLLRKAPKLRPEVKAALGHPWLEEEQEQINKKVGVDIFSKMSRFAMGKNLRRSVISYILNRKIYVQHNDSLHKIFKEIDRDGNGQIDAEEIFISYGKFFPGTLQEVWEKIKLFVEKVDINHNGKLEYSEFLAVVSILNKEINQKMLKDVFDHYDNNHNGYITATDLKEIFENCDVDDTGEFQEMIDEYDTDGDRKISFKEFYDMITNNY